MNDNISSLFPKDNKWEEIKSKLCQKRYDLEKNISSSDKQEEKGDLATKLIELKESMIAFGITEIDYQAFIAKK